MPTVKLAILAPGDRWYEAVSLTGETDEEVVFSAVAAVTGRRLALRVLSVRESTPSDVARRRRRFLREAEILASLRHDNLPEVSAPFEAMLDERATVGFAMEWPKESFEQYADRHPEGVPAEEGVRLLRDALSALQALHEHGIAVGVLSPASLFIDDSGALKLSGLSMARTTAFNRTLVDNTVSYVAPEVLDGSVRGVGQADPAPEQYFPGDLFCLGLVFYEAFAGTKWKTLPTLAAVFNAGTVDLSSKLNSWLKDRTKTLPPIGPMRPDLPPAVATLLDAMTAKEPSSRPASTQKAIAALASVPESGASDPRIVIDRTSTAMPKRAEGERSDPERSGAIRWERNGSTDPTRVVSAGGLLPVGLIVGRRYEIADEIGRGGMGVVYKARDRTEQRDVALKVLFPHCADSASVTRFQREAQSAARLQSPRIVKSLDIGQDFGLHYLVMEYVEGEDLQKAIKRAGRFDEKEAARIAIQTLSALDVAHSNGIVHRDVKTPNIILNRDRDAKLTDFGIARVLEGTRLTSTAATLGTPEYMSPEQCQGLTEIGPASDLYSVGVVLFEMLTGQLPFEAQSPSGVWLKHIQDPPRNPRELCPTLSKQMCAIVLTALVKEPQKRFASAREMIEALEGKRRIAIPARAALQRKATNLTSGQKALIVGIAGILVLSTAAGIAVAARRSSRAREAEVAASRADELRRQAEAESRRQDLERRRAEEARSAEETKRLAAEQAEHVARQRQEQAQVDQARARQAAAVQAEEARLATERERIEAAEASDRERSLAAEAIAAQKQLADREHQLRLDQEREREAERAARLRAEEREADARREAEAQQRAREQAEAQRRQEAEERARALQPSAEIFEITQQHNVPSAEGLGMAIYVHLATHNLQGSTIRVFAFVSFANGQVLQDYDLAYSCAGQVCAFADDTASYKDTNWNAFRLFIPYRQLHLARGQYSLSFIVAVRTWPDGTEYARSDAQYFTSTN